MSDILIQHKIPSCLSHADCPLLESNKHQNCKHISTSNSSRFCTKKLTLHKGNGSS